LVNATDRKTLLTKQRGRNNLEIGNVVKYQVSQITELKSKFDNCHFTNSKFGYFDSYRI